MSSCCMTTVHGDWCENFFTTFRQDSAYKSIRDKYDSVVYWNYKGSIYCLFHRPLEDGKKMFYNSGNRVVTFEQFLLFIKAYLGFAKKENSTITFKGTIFPYKLVGADILGDSVDVDLDFSDALFYENASFTSMTFKNKVEFKGTVFNSRAYFSDVIFEDSASFGNAKFEDKVRLFNASFRRVVNFKDAEFNKGVKFENISFQGGCDFRNVYLAENVIFDNVGLEKIEFLDTRVGLINFENCRWAGEEDEAKVYDEVRLDKNAGVEQVKKVESLYRQLKERNTREQHWHRVSNWHYREKEMTYRTNKLLGINSRAGFLLIYKILCGYGEKPLIAGLMLFLFGSIFAGSQFVGMLFGVESDLYNLVACNISDVLANMVDLLPLIKTKNFENSGWGRLSVGLATILITIQFGLLVMAVRNKLRR